MKINILVPEIRTKEPSYTTATTGVEVILGFTSSHTNVADNLYLVDVTLIDVLTGDVLSTEKVEVVLNSFTTYYTVSNLESERLYVLKINSNYGRVTTTYISTLSDTSVIEVVGREKIFSSTAYFYGDNIEPPINGDGAVNFKKGLDLVNNTTGNSIIVEGTKLYTFCPTHLATTLYDYPDQIYYRPFYGLPLRKIIVNKVPKITKLTNLIYRVFPATVIRITNRSAGKDVITNKPVTEINLEDYNLDSNRTVFYPVFTSIPST